jgi:ElaB/YqjD/DUF883 family membrane-anchored ribosome-binding protein
MNETLSNPVTPSSAGTGTTGLANGSAAELVQRVASSAHEAVDRVAATATPAMERLRERASSAVETVKARADQIGAIEEQWVASARDTVRAHPLTAVAIGVLAGVLIGKLTGNGRD